MTWPKIEQFVGEMPDRFAERMAEEMIGHIYSHAKAFEPRFMEAIKRPLGGNPISQERWINRVHKIGSAALFGSVFAYEKRGRHKMILLVMDLHGSSPIELSVAMYSLYRARANAPLEHKGMGLCRISRHAIARMFQRCLTPEGKPIRDMKDLHIALRRLVMAVVDNIREKKLEIEFEGGRARLLENVKTDVRAKTLFTVVTVLEPSAELVE